MLSVVAPLFDTIAEDLSEDNSEGVKKKRPMSEI